MGKMLEDRDMKDKNRLRRICNKRILPYKVTFENGEIKKFRALDYLDLHFILYHKYKRRKIKQILVKEYKGRYWQKCDKDWNRWRKNTSKGILKWSERLP